jgi:hypothetical protein
MHARNTGNNASRASTSLDDKVPARMALRTPLCTGKTGADSGAIPSRLFRRTSRRLEAGMCVNDWAAIRQLLGRISGALLTGVLCRGGEAMRGGSR